MDPSDPSGPTHLSPLQTTPSSRAAVRLSGRGSVHALSGGRQRTTQEFLMADRSMGCLPVSLSLIASFQSAVAIIGVPAEIYTHGTQYWFLGCAYVLGCSFQRTFSFLCCTGSSSQVPTSISSCASVNLLESVGPSRSSFKRSVKSIIMLDFKNVRSRTLLYFVSLDVHQVVYMGVCIYTPAFALNAVTGINLWGIVLATGLVCTLYTTLGGLKAVIWTDVIQTVVMFSGQVAVIAVGVYQTGGPSEVWRKVWEGGRISGLDLNPDPTERHTFWTLALGASSSCGPCMESCYMVFPSLQLALALSCTMGLIMFARYCGEDHSENLSSTKADAMVIYFVMDMLQSLPGLPGLFVACLFSAALSTISSAFNSLATVTLEDLIKPHFPAMSERRATLLSKALAMFYGLLCLAMAYVTHFMGDSVLLVALKIFGMVGGPILGLFCLGMFFPWANSIGALAGLAGGLSLSFWVGIGSIVSRTSGGGRTLVSDCRSGLNSTTSAVVTVALRPSGLQRFYSLSYMWYSGFTCVSVIIIGLTISFLTGPMREDDVTPGTVYPLLGKLLFFLPEISKRSSAQKERNGLSPPQQNGSDEETRTFLPETQTPNTEHETMWLLPLLCVLGLCQKELLAEGRSHKMYYVRLTIDKIAFRNVTEKLLNRNYSFTMKNSTRSVTVNLQSLTKSTECEADAGKPEQKKCSCAGGFEWTEATCSSNSQCCGSNPCTNPSSFCIPQTTVIITGSLTLESNDKTYDYHKCLNDKDTKDYKECNERVTQKIKTVYSRIYGFDSLRNIKYRVGSVIADFEVVIAAAVDPSALKNVSKTLSDEFNATLSVNTTGVVKLTAPQGPLDSRKGPVNLNCTSSIDLGTRPVWLLQNTLNQTKSITNGTESQISFPSSGSNLKLTPQSQLPLSPQWTGTYTCNFTQAADRLTMHHLATADLDVCIEPKISLSTNPAFPHCHKASDTLPVTIMCEVEQNYEEYNVSWSRENIQASLKEQPVSYGIGVKIFSTQTYLACSSPDDPQITCTLTNRCNKTTSKSQTIVMIKVGGSFCPKEGDWQDTPTGHMAEIQCSGSVGKRFRFCKEEGWQAEVSKCVDVELKGILDNAIISDIGLGELQANAKTVFSGLQSVTSNSSKSINTNSNLDVSVDVISTMSTKLDNMDNSKMVKDFLDSSSNLLNKTLQGSWNVSLTVSNETDVNTDNDTLAEKYLRSVENLIQKATLHKEAKPNLEVISCNTTLLTNGCVNTVFNNTVTIEGEGIIKTAGFLHLDEYLKDETDDFSPNSNVVSTTMQSTNKTNVEITIKFKLRKARPRNTELRCMFWDFKQTKWSTDGCELVGDPDNGACKCTHLSAFAILMSKGPLTVPYLEEVSYAGLAISIVSLIIYLVVELIIWSDVVKTDTLHLRHCAHVNIAVCLLIADVCFLASQLPGELTDVWCIVFVVMEHFCYLAMFFWMLSLSSILLHKTVYVSLHGIGKTAYLRFAIIVGYVCPLLIVAITVITNGAEEGKYYDKETRWLIYDGVMKGSIFTFIVPVLIIVFVNIFFMCLVIIKLLQPTKALKAQQNVEGKEKNSAKMVIRSVILLTPIFGLTWGLGFLMMACTSSSPHVSETEWYVRKKKNFAFNLIDFSTYASTSSVTQSSIKK
ncbi:hypothetical protein WMY93_016836 [Mugilogobius chulae]|uniref:Uncharacterized protein n=1 Tax=Mugilogobius chulae TaxID=88201 RepID=A0AAW0NQU6_9GOBI